MGKQLRVMKSRHPTMKGKLTRSFGIDETDDLVVELHEDGHVAFRKEPIHRKLKRGEQIPELRLNVAEICEELAGPPAQANDVDAILQKVADRIPVASFEDESPAKVAYKMKVWLINAVKTVIEEQKSK